MNVSRVKVSGSVLPLPFPALPVGVGTELLVEDDESLGVAEGVLSGTAEVGVGLALVAGAEAEGEGEEGEPLELPTVKSIQASYVWSIERASQNHWMTQSPAVEHWLPRSDGMVISKFF
jgi:hypothetical protein